LNIFSFKAAWSYWFRFTAWFIATQNKIKRLPILLHTERNSFMASVSNQTLFVSMRFVYVQKSFPQSFSFHFHLLIGTVLFFFIFYYHFLNVFLLMPGQIKKEKLKRFLSIKLVIMRFPFNKLWWFDDDVVVVGGGWDRWWTNKIIIIINAYICKSTDSTRLLRIVIIFIITFIFFVVFRIKTTT